MISIEDFEKEVEAFFSANFSLRDPQLDDERNDIIGRTRHGHDAEVAASREFQKKLYAAGLGAVQFPVEYGGRGLSAAHQRVVTAAQTRYDCPSPRALGIGMGLAYHTMMNSASEEIKKRYIPKIASGEESWCQLFSEPDAGSDLVSLRTRAVKDGDEWVLDGQKVWSSYAMDSDFGMCLARTNPDAPKPHVGITMFILPMRAKGVTIRPLYDITGNRHFNEVFIEGVRLGDDMIIGDVNAGWGVSQGTLSGERAGYSGGAGTSRRQRQILSAARASGKINDPVYRQRIAKVLTWDRLMGWLPERLAAGNVAGGNPAAGSLMKFGGGSFEQMCAELIADLTGISGVAWLPERNWEDSYVSHFLNASRQASIAGGTHQIQQNLLGERVLGLPRDPAPK